MCASAPDGGFRRGVGPGPRLGRLRRLRRRQEDDDHEPPVRLDVDHRLDRHHRHDCLDGDDGPGTGPTTAPTAPTAPAPPAPGTPAPTPPTVKPAPAVSVALYLQKGEIPPGQTQPLEAPAWRATGVGWDPGGVGLIVKRTDGPSVTLNVGANADADGRFEQTFVVLDVQPGTYAAIATQGDKRAEGSFVLS